MMNFQDMIAALTSFWAQQGCVVHQGYDLEVGAGTFNPATFLRCQGPEPYATVYVEPSRRPKDGRYGENPNRLQFYHQMQVILKPSPANIQDLYLQSLECIGFQLNDHDIRFVHDDWENPTIGAWGLGWEIWIDGMEVTQFTYFQAVGGLPVKPVSGEITYGLERLAMYLQGVNSIFDLKWNDTVTYGEIFKRNEWEWSHHNFKEADTQMWLRHFDDFEREAKRLIAKNIPIPAYDYVMKASHAFNILDARGVISVTERTGYIGRIRALAKQLAEAYLKSREDQGFPLLPKTIEPSNEKKAFTISNQWSAEEKEDFLLEIGSEELPATFVPIGMAGLEKEMRHFLDSHKLAYDSVHVYGTPRRLAIFVKQLQGGTSSQSLEKKGPSVEAAFDPKGVLTKAGQGFFRSVQLQPLSKQEIEEGISPAIQIRSLQGTEYLFANVNLPGQSTRQLLADALQQFVLKLDFPKKMRWGSLDIEYARPIRWLVSLYGSEEIPFQVGNCVSGRITYGHRQLSPTSISLTHSKEYLHHLKEAYVMVDVKEREASIREQLKKIESELKGKTEAIDRVMPQVLHLVEWPFLTTSSFDAQYLKAPKEVLISEMVEHQKYFPISGKDGKLLPAFIVVCNNKPTPLIQKGNQMALAPRLADGLFLYKEDLKTPLDQFNQKLKQITFQKDLGSVWGKVERVQKNVAILHPYFAFCPLDKALRAAELAKADLASELVGEFPELQGIVGRLYALHAGEDEEVANAIDEHWMPRSEKGALPATPTGMLVSLAEKLDNFLSCFSLGLQPTSSSDPYALRRQALGVIKMLIQEKQHLPLKSVLHECLTSFVSHSEISTKTKQTVAQEKDAIINGILHFINNRLRTIFLEQQFEKDEIEAVLSKGLDDIYDSYQLLSALHVFRTQKHEQFLQTLEAYTRSKKILLSQSEFAGEEKNGNSHFLAKQRRINESLLSDPTERKLHQKLEDLKQKFGLLLNEGKDKKKYEEAFGLLSEMGKPIAELFNAVKILDDNPEIKLNRLILLQETRNLCEELADFSKIQEHSD